MIAWRHEPGPRRLRERNCPELSGVRSFSQSARSKPTEDEIIIQLSRIAKLLCFLRRGAQNIGLLSIFHSVLHNIVLL